jgi:hypothetical protein
MPDTMLKQVLHKNDLSTEQLHNSCAKVRANVLKKISQRQDGVAGLFSFSYNPLLGLASCCLGVILSLLIQNNNNFNDPEEFETFSSADYTVISFLNIIEE